MSLQPDLTAGASDSVPAVEKKAQSSGCDAPLFDGSDSILDDAAQGSTSGTDQTQTLGAAAASASGAPNPDDSGSEREDAEGDPGAGTSDSEWEDIDTDEDVKTNEAPLVNDASSPVESDPEGIGSDDECVELTAEDVEGVLLPPPPSVQVWLDNEATDWAEDKDARDKEVLAALPWLIAAIQHAHLSRPLKSLVRQLLTAYELTAQLRSVTDPDTGVLAFTMLQSPLKEHLAELGSLLAEEYIRADLGTIFSPGNLDPVLIWHPQYANIPSGDISQGVAMPELAAAFDYSEAAATEMNEHRFLHGLLITAVALDHLFQARAGEVAGRHGMFAEDKTFQPAKPKSFTRASNKIEGPADYRYKPSPKAGFNVDVVRCLCACPPSVTLPFLRDVLDTFGGAVKVKNLYALSDDERAGRYHLVSIMVTVEFRPKITWGDLLSNPASRAAIDAHASTPQGFVPAERWARHCDAVLKLLNGPLRDTQPAVLSEFQILTTTAVPIRHQMHEVYKVVRADNPKQLHDDYVSTVGREPDEVGETLWWASRCGQVDVAKAHLEDGADVNEDDGTGDRAAALYIACQNGHTDVVGMLIEAEADVNLARNGDGMNPLFVAAQMGHTPIVRLLLAANAKVDAARADGGTPLFFTAYNGHTDLIELLLANGANPSLAGVNGAAPLKVASQFGQVDAVRVLLGAGAAVDTLDAETNSTPLMCAAQQGRGDIVQLLLNAGAAVDAARGSDGSTALTLASTAGHAAAAAQLLAASASVDQPQKNGYTPLMLAASQGHLETVKALLAAKAEVDLAAGGITAVYSAADRGHTDVVVELCRAGADLGLSCNGVSPLMVAAHRGHAEAVTALVEAGASLDQVNASQGGVVTAHAYAVSAGHTAIANFLQWCASV